MSVMGRHRGFVFSIVIPAVALLPAAALAQTLRAPARSWACLGASRDQGAPGASSGETRPCGSAGQHIRFEPPPTSPRGIRIAVPSAPSELMASVSGTTLFLSWASSVDGASFVIEAGSSSGGTDLMNAATGSPIRNLTATDVPPGRYFLRVRARTPSGTSAPSNEVAVTVLASSCTSGADAPRNLAASVSGSTVTLTWDGPASGCTPTAYVIEAGSGPGGLRDLANFSVANSPTSYSAAGVPSGIYYLSVRTAVIGIQSFRSNEVRIAVGLCDSVPAAPTALTSSVNGTSVTLTWTAPAGPVSSYVIEAGSASGMADILTNDLGSVATSMTATGAAGTDYVRVRAKNGCGAGPASAETIVRIIDASPFETVTKRITAFAGGDVTLPSGSRVSIPPNAFSTDRMVQLTAFRSLPAQPSNGILVGVGPALGIEISPVSAGDLSSPAQNGADRDDAFLDLVLRSGPIAGLADAVPLANFADLSGGNHFVGVPGEIDAAAGTTTFRVPATGVANAGVVTMSPAGSAMPLSTYLPPRDGGRQWNGQAWVEFDTRRFDPTRKTLIVVHGILSNVEDAYGQCMTSIMQAGGYQQVLGFNYDWTKNIQTGASSFAAFVRSTGLQEADIEAHSSGTVNVLSAVAALPKLRIPHIILEGGPLNGTSLSTSLLGAAARIEPTWTTMIVNAANILHIRNIQDVLPTYRAVDWVSGDSIPEMDPNNPLLATIRRNAVASHPETSFIKIVGTAAPEWLVRLRAANPILDPFRGARTDGVVDVSYAEGRDLPGPDPMFFDLSHTDLECSQRTIDAVGLAVRSTTPTPCTFALSATGVTIPASGGSSFVAVTTTSACDWTATSNSSFITITSGASSTTITSGASSTGNGTVSFTVAANTGAQRSGTLTVAGQTVTVTQSAAITPPPTCTFALSATGLTVAASGGASSVTVTTTAGCAWTAASNSSFITITSGASSTGNGTVSFTIAANSGAQRTGTLTIAGQTVAVTQSAATAPPPTGPGAAVGSWTGTFSASQPCSVGTSTGHYTWSGTIVLNGTTFLITWSDTFFGDTRQVSFPATNSSPISFVVSDPLVTVTFRGQFAADWQSVAGSLNGVVLCNGTYPLNGNWEGHRVGQ